MVSLPKIEKILHLPPSRHLPISEFCIDSRSVKPGSCFIAVKGQKADGHNYLQEVAARGAYAALVEKNYSGPDYGLVLLRVDNVLESLQELARVVHRERKTKVIGITGSVGKTTTKEFIAEILSGKFKIHKNPRSFNSQLTLPMVLLNAKGDEDFLILEMSMEKKGDIQRLVDIAAPEIVVLLRIAYCHAENFGSLEEIAWAKSEIFTSRTEVAFIHEASCSFEAIQESCTAENIIYPSQMEIPSPFTESHLTENFSAAYEVAKYLGMTDEEIQPRSLLLKPFERRFQKKIYQGITYIDDTYNANPASTIAALQNLPSTTGRKIVVFGSITHIGQFSFSSHRELGKLAGSVADELLCIGKEAIPMVEAFAKSGKPARFFTDYGELKKAVKTVALPGDVVLVKGSNGHKMWEIIDFIEVKQ